MSDYPKVSILTLFNKNKYDFSELMLYNINNFKYNKKLLEWVIYDDSKIEINSEEMIKLKEQIKPIKLIYHYSNSKKKEDKKEMN